MQDARRMLRSTRGLIQQDIFDQLAINTAKLSLASSSCPNPDSTLIKQSGVSKSGVAAHVRTIQIPYDYLLADTKTLSNKLSGSTLRNSVFEDIASDDGGLIPLLKGRRWSTSSNCPGRIALWRDSDASTICGTKLSSSAAGSRPSSIASEPKQNLNDIRTNIHNLLDSLGIEVIRLSLRYPTVNRKSHASGTPQSTSSSAGHNSLATPRDSEHGLVPQPLRAIKRQHSEDDDQAQSDEEDAKRRKNSKGDNHDPTRSEAPLACPFFKRDAITHQSCRRYILWTMAALKQHLWREHGIGPYFCDSCYKRFKEKTERTAHCTKGCRQTSQDPPWRYIVFQNINGRKPRGQRVEVAWSELYAHMFPKAPAPHSPYAGDDAQEIIMEVMTCLEQNNIKIEWSNLDMSGIRKTTQECVLKAFGTMPKGPSKVDNNATCTFDEEQEPDQEDLGEDEQSQGQAHTNTQEYVQDYSSQTNYSFQPASHGPIYSSSSQSHHTHLPARDRRSAPTPNTHPRVPTAPRPSSFPTQLEQVSQNVNLMPPYAPDGFNMPPGTPLPGQGFHTDYSFDMSHQNSNFDPTYLQSYGQPAEPRHHPTSGPHYQFTNHGYWHQQNRQQ